MKQRVFLALFIILLSFPACAAEGQDGGVVSTKQEEESSRQLRIFREALFQGTTDDIRVEAAVELLLRNDAASRDVLVTALKTADNPQAQQAVCKALIKSRGLGQSVGSRQIFLEPLLQLLVDAPSEEAVAAAEALLLFDFSDVESGLNRILKNDQIGQQVRINAIYALQVRPEPQALRSLIELLDDANEEVSKAAENALQETFGIPVGTSRKVWSDILDELKQKSPDDIRRERLLRQEMKLRQVQAERDRWQKLYLSSLDRQYDMSDETERAKMTLEMLGADLPAIRLWALGRVAQYQAADKEPLREKLFSLLSDESRDVRLQTAKILNNMSALNPAQKLLDCYKKENDPEVALAMFEALGEACFFAFSPGSEIELSPEIKKETMEIAVQYLLRDQTETSKKGAEVIRKILELNNLSKDSIQYYLDIIHQRYVRTVGKNPVLRADLLSVMAHLCEQGVSKSAASKMYEDAFVEGMGIEDNPPLRASALNGMTYIDPVKAYTLTKKYKLMSDGSPAVRLLVLGLVGTSGDTDDLEWLLSVMNSNGQGEQAWQAIKRICQRQKSSFLLKWLPNLEQADSGGDHVREILELAEQKAVAEKANESLRSTRKKIVEWYVAKKAWDPGVLYLDKMGFTIQDSPFDKALNAEILGIYLYAGAFDKSAQILEEEVLESDFSESNPVYSKLIAYLDDKTISDDSKHSVLDRLGTINAEDRPNWHGILKKWSSLYTIQAEPEAVPEQNSVTTE